MYEEDGQDRFGCFGSHAVRNCRSYDGHAKRAGFLFKYGPSSGPGNVHQSIRPILSPTLALCTILSDWCGADSTKLPGRSPPRRSLRTAPWISRLTRRVSIRRSAKRDEDLRGPDFFDVKNFPAMTYRGRGIRKTADGAWVMDGSLTIRGVTKEVPLTFRFKGLFPDMPAGQPARTSFHASAAVKRGDFGMTRDNLMELGPNPKGPDVEIEIDVEANASTPAK